MKRIISFLLSKDLIDVIIKAFIILIILIAFCANPLSLVGKPALIRLAVTIPINIVSQLILHIFLMAVLFYILHRMIRNRNKICIVISHIICALFCMIFLYSGITDRYMGVIHDHISSDFAKWSQVVKDLSNDDTKVIDYTGEIYYNRMPGYTTHTDAEQDHYSIYIRLSDDEFETFVVTSRDANKIYKLCDEYSSFKIEYYSNSHLIKSIEPQ